MRAQVGEKTYNGYAWALLREQNRMCGWCVCGGRWQLIEVRHLIDWPWIHLGLQPFMSQSACLPAEKTSSEHPLPSSGTCYWLDGYVRLCTYSGSMSLINCIRKLDHDLHVHTHPAWRTTARCCVMRCFGFPGKLRLRTSHWTPTLGRPLARRVRDQGRAPRPLHEDSAALSMYYDSC